MGQTTVYMALNSVASEKIRSGGRHKIIRFLQRKVAKGYTYMIGFIIVGLVVLWHFRASIGNAGFLVGGERNILDKVFRNFTFLSFEHARTLKNGFGSQIIIELSNASKECEYKNGIKLNIVKPSFPKKIDFRSMKVPTEKVAGYIRVLHYSEQMTMSVRALIALAGQAKIGDRNILSPRVKDSRFGPNGFSLGKYFNMAYFNKVLALSNYAALVGEKDYEAECSLANSSHVIIHFLYERDHKHTKKRLHFNEKPHISVRTSPTGRVGSAKCPAPRHSLARNLNAKYICVDVGKVTEWSKLEKEVIQGARCVTITNWRGIGNTFRTHFTEKHLKVYRKDLQFLLQPSVHILREADRYRRVFDGPYIGVHLRAEKILSTHNVSQLLCCVRVLGELIKALKAISGITQVLIASDARSFGSYEWKKLEELHGEVLKNLHSSLISTVDGVEYKPTAGYLDHGIVALVEMNLLTRARHLIAVGKGSFQEWIKSKFLEQHRGVYEPSWSLITMCSE